MSDSDGSNTQAPNTLDDPDQGENKSSVGSQKDTNRDLENATDSSANRSSGQSSSDTLETAQEVANRSAQATSVVGAGVLTTGEVAADALDKAGGQATSDVVDSAKQIVDDNYSKAESLIGEARVDEVHDLSADELLSGEGNLSEGSASAETVTAANENIDTIKSDTSAEMNAVRQKSAETLRDAGRVADALGMVEAGIKLAQASSNDERAQIVLEAGADEAQSSGITAGAAKIGDHFFGKKGASIGTAVGILVDLAIGEIDDVEEAKARFVSNLVGAWDDSAASIDLMGMFNQLPENPTGADVERYLRMLDRAKELITENLLEPNVKTLLGDIDAFSMAQRDPEFLKAVNSALARIEQAREAALGDHDTLEARLNALDDEARKLEELRAELEEQGAFAHTEKPQIGAAERSNIYTIQRNDTLSEIAKRFGVSEEELAAANGITDRHTIISGQELIIPSAEDPDSLPLEEGDAAVYDSEPPIEEIVVTAPPIRSEFDTDNIAGRSDVEVLVGSRQVAEKLEGGIVSVVDGFDNDDELQVVVGALDTLSAINDGIELYNFDQGIAGNGLYSRQMEANIDDAADVGRSVLGLRAALDNDDELGVLTNGIAFFDSLDDVLTVGTGDGGGETLGFLGDIGETELFSVGDTTVDVNGALAVVGLVLAIDSGDAGAILNSGIAAVNALAPEVLKNVSGLEYVGAITSLLEGDIEGAAISAVSTYASIATSSALTAAGPIGMAVAMVVSLIFSELLAETPPDPTAGLDFNRNEDGSIGFETESNETGQGLESNLQQAGGGLAHYLGALEDQYYDFLLPLSDESGYDERPDPYEGVENAHLYKLAALGVIELPGFNTAAEEDAPESTEYAAQDASPNAVSTQQALAHGNALGATLGLDFANLTAEQREAMGLTEESVAQLSPYMTEQGTVQLTPEALASLGIEDQWVENMAAVMAGNPLTAEQVSAEQAYQASDEDQADTEQADPLGHFVPRIDVELLPDGGAFHANRRLCTGSLIG